MKKSFFVSLIFLLIIGFVSIASANVLPLPKGITFEVNYDDESFEKSSRIEFLSPIAVSLQIFNQTIVVSPDQASIQYELLEYPFKNKNMIEVDPSPLPIVATNMLHLKMNNNKQEMILCSNSFQIDSPNIQKEAPWLYYDTLLCSSQLLE